MPSTIPSSFAPEARSTSTYSPNDLVGRGEQLALDPGSVQSPEAGGLAFAAGRSVRFVAPETAGVYLVFYTAYSAGSPDLRDSAALTILVSDGADNAPPVPLALTGRVASGSSVSIPFDPVGLDPDGDRVTLTRIVDQPRVDLPRSPPTVGRSSYTSVTGFAGQVAFDYEVRDARGEVATAIVRVG